jgi:hypothetical protein
MIDHFNPERCVYSEAGWTGYCGAEREPGSRLRFCQEHREKTGLGKTASDFNRYQYEILDVCADIKRRAALKDEGTDAAKHRYLWLKHRLATWEPSGERFSHYDRVVKELAVTAVTIAEQEWPEWRG